MLSLFIDVMLHLDRYLADWSAALGGWTYALLFVVVFCETGLVVTPFLPGDSLLFAAGALTALPGSGLSIWPMVALLIVAAVLGDALNYAIGARIGDGIVARGGTRFVKLEHIRRAQAFAERWGVRAIFLARFFPILRTFAPFVAGIGKMPYSRFAVANVSGGIVWVAGFSIAGWAFGGIPAVKERFHVVILAIVGISFLPVIFEVWRARREMRAEAAANALPEAE